MQRRASGLFSLVILGLLASAARCAEIVNVSPASGAYSSSITIFGSGFGAGKPHVFLRDDASGKLFKPKLIGWSDSVISIELRKGVPGPMSLLLKPRGAGTPWLSAPFTYIPINVTSLYPPQAPPGEMVVLVSGLMNLHYPAKVKIGGKQVKLYKFPFAYGPALEIPESMTFGSKDVEITTPSGTTTLPGGLTILDRGPPLGPDRLMINVDGEPHVFKPGEFQITNQGTMLVLRGYKSGDDDTLMARLSLWYQPDVTPVPVTIHELPPYEFPYDSEYWSGPFECSHQPVDPLPGHSYSWSHATDWQVTIDAASGGQIGGTFSGLCHSATEPDQVISGSFIATIPYGFSYYFFVTSL